MKNTVQQRITYRPFEQKDRAGVFELWEEESGWGGLTEEQFARWFLNTPYGDCLIVVAVDEDDTVRGQLVYGPARVVAGGKVIRALRGAAPILHHSLRGGHLRGANHPALQLIVEGLKQGAAQGYQLAYSFPAYGWVAMLRSIPQFYPCTVDVTTCGCFGLSLTGYNTKPAVAEEYCVVEIDTFGNEHEVLWMDALAALPVGVAVHRQAPWLNRVATAHHTKLEVRAADNRLLGYAIIKKDSGLLNDIVARSSADLKTVFDQTVWAMHTANPARLSVSFQTLKGMRTPATEALLSGYQSTDEDYRFAFGVCLLDDALARENFTTHNWYLTPLG